MILFTILFIILVVLAILTVLGVAALGAAGIVVFGDVIVCVVIIALIIRHFIKKSSQEPASSFAMTVFPDDILNQIFRQSVLQSIRSMKPWCTRCMQH